MTIAGTSSFVANNNVAIGTSRSNTLTVNSDSTFNGAVIGVVGVQVRAVVITPSAAAPVILNKVSFVDATANTGASNILRLPIPILGLHIRIAAGGTRFLLQSFGATYLINGDTSGSTSHTVFPNQLVDCVAVSATTFYCSRTGPSWTCTGTAACFSLGTFAIAQNFPNEVTCEVFACLRANFSKSCVLSGGMQHAVNITTVFCTLHYCFSPRSELLYC